MIVTLGFHAGDKPQAVRLARWIAELGTVRAHDCLLAVYKDTDSAGVIEPLREVFGRTAEFTITDDMIPDRARYQFCANRMWKRTAQHIADMNEPAPWLWLEPDAVPLCAGWLDAIEAGYRACGKPFMLDRIVTPTSIHNSGVGVYPAFVRDYTTRLWKLANDPWDVFLAPDITRHTYHGELIHDGVAMKPAPDFRNVRPGTVLWHPDKSGMLIDRLRESRLNGFRPKDQLGGAGSIPAEFAGSRSVIGSIVMTPGETEQKPALFRTIYTYCEPLGEKWNDPELTELCRESWLRQGWELIVLTDSDARGHPLHDALMSRKELHSPGDLHDYINACYRRFLAFAVAAAGKPDIWTCDVDCINYGFTALAAGAIEPRDRLTLCNDSPTPCMTHGAVAHYEFVIQMFMEFAEHPHTNTPSLKESISDQNLLDAYRGCWVGMPLVTEYLQPDWQTADLVHWPFARLYLPGKRGAAIKKIRPLPDSAPPAPVNGNPVESIAGQMRYHCAALAALVAGKHNRRQMFHTELRKVHLIGAVKKRMAVK